jgi:hypothetical protein
MIYSVSLHILVSRTSKSLELSSEIGFNALPCLTHLAFNGLPNFLDETEYRRLTHVLETCLCLEMLLLLVGSRNAVSSAVEVPRPIASPRLFVWLDQSLDLDWEDHPDGDDIWKKAKRNPESFVMPPSVVV